MSRGGVVHLPWMTAGDSGLLKKAQQLLVVCKQPMAGLVRIDREAGVERWT